MRGGLEIIFSKVLDPITAGGEIRRARAAHPTPISFTMTRKNIYPYVKKKKKETVDHKTPLPSSKVKQIRKQKEEYITLEKLGV